MRMYHTVILRFKKQRNALCFCSTTLLPFQSFKTILLLVYIYYDSSMLSLPDGCVYQTCASKPEARFMDLDPGPSLQTHCPPSGGVSATHRVLLPTTLLHIKHTLPIAAQLHTLQGSPQVLTEIAVALFLSSFLVLTWQAPSVCVSHSSVNAMPTHHCCPFSSCSSATPSPLLSSPSDPPSLLLPLSILCLMCTFLTACYKSYMHSNLYKQLGATNR